MPTDQRELEPGTRAGVPITASCPGQEPGDRHPGRCCCPQGSRAAERAPHRLPKSQCSPQLCGEDPGYIWGQWPQKETLTPTTGWVPSTFGGTGVIT